LSIVLKFDMLGHYGTPKVAELCKSTYGQVVPMATRTLPTGTQFNSYPIPTRTQRALQRTNWVFTVERSY